MVGGSKNENRNTIINLTVALFISEKSPLTKTIQIFCRYSFSLVFNVKSIVLKGKEICSFRLLHKVLKLFLTILLGRVKRQNFKVIR
jgi:hypothetical protein